MKQNCELKRQYSQIIIQMFSETTLYLLLFITAISKTEQ